jgi:hypothetical protein
MSSIQKRILQKQYSIWNKTRVFPFETFAILVSYLIKQTYTSENIYYIDIEYWGKNGPIKQWIMDYLIKTFNIQIRSDQILFTQVGKKSPSHKYAYDSFSGRYKNRKQTITAAMIENIKKDRRV